MEHNKHITRLVVMDFDGTLMDTMTPDIGKPMWEKHTGTEWPHKGWWSKEESLDTEVFGSKPIQKVVDAYYKERRTEGSRVVMMTGRREKLRSQVINMLGQHQLVFDEYRFNRWGDTLTYKLKELDKFVQDFPNLESLEIWEDRPEHTQAFQEWCNTQSITCVVNQV